MHVPHDKLPSCRIPRDVPDEPPPFLGTWRRVYIAILIYLVFIIVGLLPLHAGLSMRPLDWVVLVTSLVSIVAYGLYRSRGSNTVDRYLLAGKTHAVVRHGALHHGHAGQRHHLHLHHRPILRGRHALRAVLFRPAHRHGDHLRHRGADLPSRQSLHRVRIPGEALRRQDARAGQHHFPLPARPLRRAHDLRAGDSCSPSSWAGRNALTTLIMGVTVVTYTVLGGIKAVTWIGRAADGASSSLGWWSRWSP